MGGYLYCKMKHGDNTVVQFKCPGCGNWGDLDDDQFNGRVSIFDDRKECGFHETINVAKVGREITVAERFSQRWK